MNRKRARERPLKSPALHAALPFGAPAPLTMSSLDTQRVPDTAAPAPLSSASCEALMANAIRALAMDAVQQANSGHPGAPMGMAEIAVALWGRHLRHNPAHPQWPGRDRFVLSNGHGSMLLYALLHLTGYDLPMSELRNFRQLHSKTPGHPEVGVTPGVTPTSGWPGVLLWSWRKLRSSLIGRS